MRFSAGKILTAAGAVVAAFGAIAMTIGLKFSMPPEIYTIVVYKAIFAAAAGLMIVGAMAGRRAREKRKAGELERNESDAALLKPSSPSSAPDFVPADPRARLESRDAVEIGSHIGGDATPNKSKKI